MLTFANGGDNIGVYVPVFVAGGSRAVVTYSIAFLALVAILVLPPNSSPPEAGRADP